jgi:hypothetical protein
MTETFVDAVMRIYEEIMVENSITEAPAPMIEISRGLRGGLFKPWLNQILISYNKDFDEHDIKLILTHELAHFLLYQAGFRKHGHGAAFLAMHSCLWPGTYASSGALAMDKRQCALWHVNRAAALLQIARNEVETNIHSIARSIVRQTSTWERMTARLGTDGRNGLKQWKILAFVGAALGVMIFQSITGFVPFSPMVAVGFIVLIVLKSAT